MRAGFARASAKVWAEALGGVRGIALLTIGKPAGLARFGSDEAAVLRSFVAAGLSLPLFVLLRLTDWLAGTAPLEHAHAFGIDLLSYVIGWAGFVLLSRPVARHFGKERRWPHYIVAWNWCNLAQYVLLLAASLPTLFHAPPIASETAALFGFGWALWLEWYVAKLTLDIDALPAALLVLIDVGLTVGLGLLATLPFQGWSFG
jgi:hypothetical protein